MKKLRWLAFGIILTGLVGGPVMAGRAGAGQEASPAAQGEPQAESEVKSGVSQVQLDIMNKREQARQRRDEMLRVRAQTIEAEEERARKEAGAPAK